MTKEIKKVISHMLEISERMLAKDTPILSKVVGVVHKWLLSIDMKYVRSLPSEDKKAYEWEMVQRLHDAIGVNDEATDPKN